MPSVVQKERQTVPSADANSPKFCKVSDFFVWTDVVALQAALWVWSWRGNRELPPAEFSVL